MGRKKIEMTKIESNNKRMTTYRKRRNVIIKKANELATLCDVPVCVIIYGARGEPPSVWPEESEKMNDILARYLNTSVEERRKRTLSLSTLLGKTHKEEGLDLVRDKHVEVLPKIGYSWDESIKGFSSEQLMALASQLNSKIETVERKIDAKRNSGQCLPKLEDAKYYAGDVQQNMMLMMPMPDLKPMQSFPYQQFQCQTPGNNHHLYLEEQRRNAAELNRMNNAAAAAALYTNYNNSNSNININSNNNINNVDLGGFMTGNMMNNGLLWNPYPVAWYDPNAQLQAQANQFNGAQIPSRHESTNYS